VPVPVPVPVPVVGYHSDQSLLRVPRAWNAFLVEIN
jgi:hypothetical protein